MSITDYPRASVSFPRDRRLGERDWTFSYFEAAITQKLLENQGARNDVLYVVFYKLSGDTSYFSKKIQKRGEFKTPPRLRQAEY